MTFVPLSDLISHSLLAPFMDAVYTAAVFRDQLLQLSQDPFRRLRRNIRVDDKHAFIISHILYSPLSSPRPPKDGSVQRTVAEKRGSCWSSIKAFEDDSYGVDCKRLKVSIAGFTPSVTQRWQIKTTFSKILLSFFSSSALKRSSTNPVRFLGIAGRATPIRSLGNSPEPNASTTDSKP